MTEKGLPQLLFVGVFLASGSVLASYTNFEVSHVHPIDLTPSGGRLLVVNTPDAVLEVFTVLPSGDLARERSIQVGLEPVTVAARTDTEAWVVNNLSDTVSIVDLNLGIVVQTLAVGDEPTDVVFAQGKAFVAVSQEDVVKAYNLSNLGASPAWIEIFSRDVRALAVSNDAQKVYAVTLRSGNQTTSVSTNAVFPGQGGLTFNQPILDFFNLRNLDCASTPPPPPPLPAGIVRNPALPGPTDPRVSLIVRWNRQDGKWIDEAGQDWTLCLPYRLPDHDLFIIDAANPTAGGAVLVDHLGTSLFEVSVHPSGRIYVPNTDARNFVRFEHPLGLRGHPVDNRLAVVDPANNNQTTLIDLNTHVNRASDPVTNLGERMASVSQPGMLVWSADGSQGYMTAIGSRKLFRVDGGCLAGSCIFGPNRAVPGAVEVGEGPTGVALHEGRDRVYVLNRVSHSISIVEASSLVQLDELPLHDPSSVNTRNGRRFLYDAIDGSAHGDAACSSCHISGDLDGLAWELGDPTARLVKYVEPYDNVRFVRPVDNLPEDCPPSICAAHPGFDPQKGPMVTPSLRALLEPLHLRGDRPTVTEFNQTFVELMGARDIGPINGRPAALPAADMELLRQFLLETRFPPNPFRKVDDTLPQGTVLVHGMVLPGFPVGGEGVFASGQLSVQGQRCNSCHASSFGTAGGVLGGVTPTEPTSTASAALTNGTVQGSPHSDLKVPHLRNIYDKFGPILPSPGLPPWNTATGFGYTHDGSIPDVVRFLSTTVFEGEAPEYRTFLAAFLFHFPTGTKPAVGRQVTVPAGTPPTGPAATETLLSTLVSLGDLANPTRHCELVAATIADGRPRSYHLVAGAWVTDVAGEPAVSMTALREGAQGPITFTCSPGGSGARLGGNRDEDVVLDGDDCAVDDAATWRAPVTVTHLSLGGAAPTLLTWDDQQTGTGPSLRHDVLGGELSALRGSGVTATSCIDGSLAATSFTDERPDPAPGEGYYYLIRAVNPCGSGPLGPGLEPIQNLACPGT